MTARILPREEWPRLQDTELGTVWPMLSPESATVCVVEDETGAIVGCWSLLSAIHAEGLWIAPAHRGAGAVARRLLRLLRETAQALGVTQVLTASMSPTVDHLLAHVGATPVPGTTYIWPLVKE